MLDGRFGFLPTLEMTVTTSAVWPTDGDRVRAFMSSTLSYAGKNVRIVSVSLA
ncbi:hypothetical protein SAMN05445504_9320 [Burkholderia sp. CF099]|nr:hypothetical protein SAMN05445504_9320 [Burkholderia sp. CF099]